jgi:SOS-response transcriptional repressor LexA
MSKAQPKEEKVWSFIKEFRKEHPYGPTLREIQKAVGVSSPSMVIWYLDKLEKAGRIRRERRLSRSIVVLE